MGLIEVKQAVFSSRQVFALGSHKGVAEPTEESIGRWISQKRFEPIDASGSLVCQLAFGLPATNVVPLSSMTGVTTS